MLKENIFELIEVERRAFRSSKDAGDRQAAWIALERGHILGQGFFWPHIQSHIAMLGFAVETRDGREILGQAIRLALAPLGNLTKRLPWGNTGRANVSAFKEMPYPDDLANVVSQSFHESS